MAKKFPMDLSKFKKVKMDEVSTTLRHPEGHEIKIAHKAISPEMHSQLKELPHFDGGGTVTNPDGSTVDPNKYGGSAPPKPDPRKAVSEYFNSGYSKKPSKTAATGYNEAHGGMIPHYAEGTPEGVPEQEQDSAASRAGKYVGDTLKGAVGDTIGAFKTVGAPVADFAQGLMGDNPSAPDAAPPEAPAPVPLPPTAPQPPAPITGKSASIFDPSGTSVSEPAMREGYNQQILGNKAQAKAASDKGIEEQAVLGEAVKAQQIQQQTYQDTLKSLTEEHDNLMHDISNSHIDPTHYLGSLDTGHKITTAIGLLLGGMGSGLTGGENPAMQFINSQIDRDIDVQKANLGKKESLLSANMRHYGNIRDAMDATRAGMQGIVGMQIQQAAAKATGPAARALAQLHNGELEQQTAGTFGQMAARKTLMSGEAGGVKDPTQLVQMLVPAEHRKEVAAEIDRAQDTVRMGDQILKSFDQATHENTALKTGFGKLRTPGSVFALHQAMQPTFKDLEGTVRQAAMDNTFKNITPGPGDSAHTIAQKREALIGYLQSKASASLAKSYGIDLSKFPSTATDQAARMSPEQQQWVVWARQNPQDPRAQAVLKKLGTK